MGQTYTDCSTSTGNTYTDAQLHRLKLCDVERLVDVHCHCLPALDDGPNDIATAVQLCRLLVDDGITSVVASPHQLGQYDLNNHPAKILGRIALLAETLADERIPLEIAPGADIRIDERLPDLLDSRVIFTAGDLERHILLELPTQSYCEPRALIRELLHRDIQCIVTHPERHRYLKGNFDIAMDWLRAGALIQVTAGSLVGDFGRSAFAYAWSLLRYDMVALVATDAHDHFRRPPRMTAAFNAICQELGLEIAKRVCVEHPLKVWRGESIRTPFN